MLLEFTVGNFLSFKEDNTLSLVASSLKARNTKLNDGAMTPVGGGKALHSAVIYGANASGKSNFVQALAFFKRWVQDSAREGQSGDPIEVTPFLFHEDTREEPSFFEAVFQHKGLRYRYGFEVSRTCVEREWLYYRKKRETKLFVREGQEIDATKLFAPDRSLLKTPPRDNALFLSVAAQRNISMAVDVMGWFQSIGVLSGLHDLSIGYTARCLENERFAGRLRELICSLDLGIAEIQVEKVSLGEAELSGLPQEVSATLMGKSWRAIKTVHSILDDEGSEIAREVMDLQTESEGTRKLFALAGPVLDTLTHGRVMVIDEFDARLHPLISQELVRLFQDQSTNPHGAQLIIATHDTNLLTRGLYRRDQIWFVEKSRRGESVLYSLAAFKVRNDADYEADYFRGRYGAVPFLGGLRRVIEASTEE